ncbi:hypothetical protein VIBHAR_03215 [Vibrio campbellii ATCC BAA-1116]|uniref:Uncharacterized protein n=1 Tax=Vibrio campbellii (strain ATCC BAA-1116) TaxID=2902295 RepID=A7MY08_VIBC1|nr:hypothetical protein VIBHAR_03215 [Vibrio campbellii ATCC BAA-1116]
MDSAYLGPVYLLLPVAQQCAWQSQDNRHLVTLTKGRGGFAATLCVWVKFKQIYISPKRNRSARGASMKISSR